jgi:uncharacterized protein YjbI with pentapeptide repeats
VVLGTAAPIGFLPPTWLIFVVGFVLAGSIFAVGIWAWLAGHQEHASQLLTGAMVAFAVLIVQLMIESRAGHDNNLRQAQGDREALLLLLGRQNDLSGVDLRAKDLVGSYLNGKVLNDADLSAARLGSASLIGAKLISAKLVDADLNNAHLGRTDLRQANLSGANLSGAWLRGAKLDAATLGPTLGAHRRKIPAANLTGAHLENAFLRADLQYADLTGAHLQGAHLAPANLSHALLAGADFEHTDLRGAILEDVDLRQTKNLGQALDLSLATYNSRTLWPDGFKWPNAKPRPCRTEPCRLPAKKIHRFPRHMRDLETTLQKLTDDLHCPPGWTTDPSDPFVLRVVSARELAHFEIRAQDVPQDTTAKQWAESYPGNRNVRPLTNVHARLGATYAERYAVGTARAPREEVAVYQIVKGQGYRYLSSSSAALFPLFERDFASLFLAVGIRGPLFDELEGQQSVPCKG